MRLRRENRQFIALVEVLFLSLCPWMILLHLNKTKAIFFLLLCLLPQPGLILHLWAAEFVSSQQIGGKRLSEWQRKGGSNTAHISNAVLFKLCQSASVQEI